MENENSEANTELENSFDNEVSIETVSEMVRNYDSLFTREKYTLKEKLIYKYVKLVKNLNIFESGVDDLKKYVDLFKQTEYTLTHIFINDIQFVRKSYFKTIEFLISDHTFPKGIPAVFEYESFNQFDEEKHEKLKLITTSSPLTTFDIQFIALDPRQIIRDGYKKEQGEKLKIIDVEIDAGIDCVIKRKNSPINTYQII